MEVAIKVFKGRAAEIDPKTMTGTARVTAKGQIAVRLEDSECPEFCLEFVIPVLCAVPAPATVPDLDDEEAE